MLISLLAHPEEIKKVEEKTNFSTPQHLIERTEKKKDKEHTKKE